MEHMVFAELERQKEFLRKKLVELGLGENVIGEVNIMLESTVGQIIQLMREGKNAA